MTHRVTPQSGFSLMEVMVALGILATTAIGFLELTGSSISAAGEVEERYLARIVADNQMVDVFSTPIPLERGDTQGVERQMGRNFVWTRSIEEGPRDGLLLIRVDVHRGDSAGRTLARLSTVKADVP